MSLSRRRFLTGSAVTALLTGAHLSDLAAAALQGKQKLRAPHRPPKDSLQAAFTDNLNSQFTFAAWFGPVAVALVAVDESPGSAQPDGESFSLVFEGESSASLSQDTYPCEHDALGVFPLFLVPGASDNAGRQRYVAIVNRLPQSPPLLQPRSRSKKAGTKR